MAYPQGYLYQPSASLALYSCPAYSTSVISGPRTEELGRSSSGSAFAPYAASTAFSGASAAYSSHLPYAADAAAAAAATFTSYVSSPYDHTTGMAGSIGYHPYAAPLGSYPYGDPAYRKNATRDATATLKAWLNEHRKNPYPTKGEKIMLAIITKMTLTQVSTWFANARRRLKKENKMTWSPKNKAGEEKKENQDKIEQESVIKDPDCKEEQELHLSDLDDIEDEDEEDYDKLDSDCEKSSQDTAALPEPTSSPPKTDISTDLLPPSCKLKDVMALPPDYLNPLSSKQALPTLPVSAGPVPLPIIQSSDEKPRIWSLARTAATGMSQHRPELQTGGTRASECQLQVSQVPTLGRSTFCENAKSLRDPTNLDEAGSLFEEGLNKVYSAASYRGLQRHCSSYQALTESCQYSSMEGFCGGGKSEAESCELSDTCLTLQDAKTTAFRPVMKR